LGREHIGTWERIFPCITCLIVFLFLGCATVKNSENRNCQSSVLLQGQKLISGGDFEGALIENERVMSLFTKEPPGDQALYNMGLIYAHYMNPDKDFNKSKMYFEKLIEEFPQSELAGQAQIWARLIKELSEALIKEPSEALTQESSEALTQEPSEALIKEPSIEQEYFLRSSKMLSKGDYQGSLKENKKVLSLYNTAPPVDQALFNIGLIYAHFGNPDKDYLEAIQYLEKLIQKYPESPLVEQAKIWVNVLNIIEKAKQVDIEIDKKKKELTR